MIKPMDIYQQLFSKRKAWVNLFGSRILVDVYAFNQYTITGVILDDDEPENIGDRIEVFLTMIEKLEE